MITLILPEFDEAEPDRKPLCSMAEYMTNFKLSKVKLFYRSETFLGKPFMYRIRTKKQLKKRLRRFYKVFCMKELYDYNKFIKFHKKHFDSTPDADCSVIESI